MRIIIILFFGIVSYLIVFLPGFFLLEQKEDENISEGKLISEKNNKVETLTLKNPGKEPLPK